MSKNYKGSNPFGEDVLSKGIQINRDGVRYCNLEDGSSQYDNLGCTYKWQCSVDGTYKDMEDPNADPIAVGDYRLVVTIPEKQDSHDKVEATLDGFKITKAPVTVTAKIQVDAKSGDTVKDIKDKAVINLQSATPDYDNFVLSGDSADIVVTDKKIYDAAGTELTDDKKLYTSDSVILKAGIAFNDKAEEARKSQYANYTLVELEPFAIEAVDLIGTELEVELLETARLKDGKIHETYTGNAITPAPTYKTDFNVKVTADGEEIALSDTNAVISGEWVEEIAETVRVPSEGRPGAVGTDYKVIDPPTNADTYTYRIRYEEKTEEGASKRYADSEAYITVVIDKASNIVLEPKVGKDADGHDYTFREHMTVADVLARIDYNVLRLENGTTSAWNDFDKDHFWGTSYREEEATQGATQPYTPVWKLQVKGEGENGAYVDVDEDSTLLRDKQYRIIFSGEKAVYNAESPFAGDIPEIYSDKTDINSPNGKPDPNLEVNKEESFKKYLDFTATPATDAYVDISGLLVSGAGKEMVAPIRKTYDGTGLYSDKKSYKDNVFLSDKAENGTKLQADLEDFTFRWQKNYCYNGSDEYEDYAEWQVDNKNKDTADFDRSWTTGNYTIPSEAGIYRLQVSYHDPDGEYYAAPAYVYYVIDRRPLTLKAPDAGYTVYTGTRINDFFRKGIQHELLNSSGTAMEWVEDEDYGLTWHVELVSVDAQGEVTFVSRFDEESSSTFTTPAEGSEYRLVLDSYKGDTDDEDNPVPDTDVRNNTLWKTTEVPPTDTTDPEAKYTLTSEVQTTPKPLKINVVATGEGTLAIDSVEDAALVKDYDGKAFTREELSTLFTVSSVAADGTKTPVTDPAVLSKLEYRLSNYDSYEPYDDIEEYVNAGHYILRVGFTGDAAYQVVPAASVSTNIFINKQVLTMKVPQITGVVAGDAVWTIWSSSSSGIYTHDDDSVPRLDVSGITVDGSFATEEDKAAFNAEGSFTAFWSSYNLLRSFSVVDETGTQPGSNSIFKTGTAYRLVYEEGLGNEDIDYGRNYTVKLDAATESFTASNGRSKISTDVEQPQQDSDFELLSRENVTETDGSVRHTLEILEGIPYIYNWTFKEEHLEGNFVKVAIRIPRQFRKSVYNDMSIPKTAVYKNAIEAAGGEITPTDNGQIQIVFDATEGRIQANPVFTINWEPGFAETFEVKLMEASKLADLKQAVSPKSLKFNAAPKKMMVGEEEYLDVKITKASTGDIICLNYEVLEQTPDKAGEQVLTVDENGKATALGTGTATVRVYPVYINEKGEKTEITKAIDPKVKDAKTKITVIDVGAPKIQGVRPLDTTAELRYAPIENGYRREIYLLKTNGMTKKVLTQSYFESRIASMKDENWHDIFAIAPIYCDQNEEDKLQELYQNWGSVIIGLDDLTSDTEYAVYVRNVSAIRTLDDGSKIAASAAGSVHIFRTTKPQVKELRSALKDIEPKRVTNLVYEGYRTKVNVYTIDFMQTPPAEIDIDGKFDTHPSDKYADDEERWIDLPLTGEDANIYAQPGLVYSTHTVRQIYNSDLDEYEYKVNVVPVEGNPITVDRNGKIKLNRIDRGLYFLMAKDTATGLVTGVLLNTTATADAIAAKKAKVQLQVGESVSLSSLLNYKVRKKVINGYYDFKIDTESVKNAIGENNQYFSFDGSRITALQTGGPALALTLTDAGVPNSSAKVTLTVKALDPVKGLKAVDVIDKEFKITFTKSQKATRYLIELLDSRMNLMKKYHVDAIAWTKWNKTQTVEIKGLTQLSKYTVRVTAVNEKGSSKPAKKAVKTTKIPAWYEYLPDKDTINQIADPDNDIPRIGMPVYIQGSGYNRELSSSYVLSGNIYTLTTRPQANRARLTDTLKWKSSNPKVASVKAGAGSFSASLKALSPGFTTIEVSSKIWKNKVIARYSINVMAVGDAYKTRNQYYGPDEQDGWQNSSHPGSDPAGPLVLNEGSARKISEETDMIFTVPQDGRYLIDVEYGDTFGMSHSQSEFWKKGDIVRFTAYPYGSYSSAYVTATLTEPLESMPPTGELTADKGTTYFTFTADQAGWYYVYTDPSGSDFSLYDEIDGINSNSGYPQIRNASFSNGYRYLLEEKQTVYGKLYNDGEAVTLHIAPLPGEDLGAASGTAVEKKLSGSEAKWLSFTAAEAGTYKVSVTGSGIDTPKIIDGSSVYGTYLSGSSASYYAVRNMGAGDKFYLEVQGSSQDETAEATISIKVEKLTASLTLDATEKTLTVPAKDYGYASYTASEAGVYKFVLSETGSGAYLASSIADFYGYQYDSVSATYNYGMSAGETVFLIVSNTGDTPLEVKVKVSNAKDDPDAPKMIMDNKVDAIEADTYYGFTAPEDGLYGFSLSSTEYNVSAYAYLYGKYVNGSGNDNLKYGNIDAISYEYHYMLRAGETVWLYIRNINPAPSSVDTVGLSVKCVSQAKALSLGSSIRVSSAEEQQYYVFTSPESGSYKFMIEPTDYVNATLYSANGNRVSSFSWDSMRDENNEWHYFYSCTCDIAKGQTYYILQNISDIPEGGFTISVVPQN